jgi:hypothetical protein
MGQGPAALREMQILHAVFLLAVFLLVYAAEQLRRTTTGYSKVFLGLMISLAILNWLQAYYFRRKRRIPVLGKLHLDPSDTRALKQWRGAIAVILSLAESIAFYGCILRLFGGSRLVSWPFFGLALILMLVWRPQLQLGAVTSGVQANQ